MAPNQTQLRNLTQKTDESFKEYSQYWRELAARVQTPLLEKEMINMFMGTLQGPYLEKLIRITPAGFSDLVIAGERIENCLKNRKIQSVVGTSNGPKKPYVGFAKKKEGKTNNTSVARGRGRTYRQPYEQMAIVALGPYQQQPYAIPTEQNIGQQPAQYRQPYAHPHQQYYQPTYVHLLPYLVKGSLI